MTLYRFTVDSKVSENGPQFQARFAASTIDGQKLLRSSLMPTTTIADGTTLETADKVTDAVLAHLASIGPGALGVGVTVSVVASAALVTNYDAATLAARTAAPPSEGKPIDAKAEVDEGAIDGAAETIKP
jgi:hypothetical protein